MKKPTVKSEKQVQRCGWVPIGNTLLEEYHDKEWGVPVHDDQIHFEFLILEGAQAGLSWEIILKRRKEYALAFSNFDWEKVALYDQNKIENILKNSGIIRNRLKVEGAVNNAKRFIEVRKEFGSFDTYIWQFVGGKPKHSRLTNCKEIPCETAESQALSKDLRKRGFKFVGPKIMYSHMQAIGMVNDHTTECFRS
jgi:DNA-3-methyladenine glycosylase I